MNIKTAVSCPDMIQTERFWWLPTCPLKPVSQDWGSLSQLLGGVDMADHWLHFPEAMIWMRDYLQENETELGWWNYLIVHRKDVRLIGTCGYKGSPSLQGEVEIGYEIAEAYQGQGLATEAARALVEYAFGYEDVQFVSANTLPEKNASNTLLQKLGFQFTGEEMDIEDGKVWTWRLDR
ncbi:MAG: GNAT family N-acetyltransferase [Saprospiraceae bacterium]